jgi:23S rRNA (cytidine1920-2'-O)/16S rRNA (cytidine1409-2'-O)-methyltransferase
LKLRLDTLLVNRQLADSIPAAQAMILAGEVIVDNCRADKPGNLYSSTADIRLRERCPFVSRGGLKLLAGILHFQLNPESWVCVDVGASTGGFTDCLLQKHAAKVFAIDVAYGQLSWKLRSNPRVVVLERFNARNLSRADLGGETLDLAVLDVSFISLTTLIPPLLSLFTDKARILALIKPQFELSRHEVGEGGVVLDPKLHEKAQEKLICFSHTESLHVQGIIASPLLGPKGNKEFLVYLTSS